MKKPEKGMKRTLIALALIAGLLILAAGVSAGDGEDAPKKSFFVSTKGVEDLSGSATEYGDRIFNLTVTVSQLQGNVAFINTAMNASILPGYRNIKNGIDTGVNPGLKGIHEGLIGISGGLKTFKGIIANDLGGGMGKLLAGLNGSIIPSLQGIGGTIGEIQLVTGAYTQLSSPPSVPHFGRFKKYLAPAEKHANYLDLLSDATSILNDVAALTILNTQPNYFEGETIEVPLLDFTESPPKFMNDFVGNGAKFPIINGGASGPLVHLGGTTFLPLSVVIQYHIGIKDGYAKGAFSGVKTGVGTTIPYVLGPNGDIGKGFAGIHTGLTATASALGEKIITPLDTKIITGMDSIYKSMSGSITGGLGSLNAALQNIVVKRVTEGTEGIADVVIPELLDISQGLRKDLKDEITTASSDIASSTNTMLIIWIITLVVVLVIGLIIGRVTKGSGSVARSESM